MEAAGPPVPSEEENLKSSRRAGFVVQVPAQARPLASSEASRSLRPAAEEDSPALRLVLAQLARINKVLGIDGGTLVWGLPHLPSRCPYRRSDPLRLSLTTEEWCSKRNRTGHLLPFPFLPSRSPAHRRERGLRRRVHRVSPDPVIGE